MQWEGGGSGGVTAGVLSKPCGRMREWDRGAVPGLVFGHTGSYSFSLKKNIQLITSEGGLAGGRAAERGRLVVVVVL